MTDELMLVLPEPTIDRTPVQTAALVLLYRLRAHAGDFGACQKDIEAVLSDFEAGQLGSTIVTVALHELFANGLEVIEFDEENHDTDTKENNDE